jgi:hypothetical protein
MELSPLDLLTIISEKNEVIAYMRDVVKAYVDIYERIGNKLKELDDDEEPDSDMEVDIEQCFDTIQPLLSLYEDTRPENIEKTLAQYKLLKTKHVSNITLN